MRDMFYGCSSLKVLNISNFNTNNVAYSSGMFYGCSNALKNEIKFKNKNFINEEIKLQRENCCIII